MYQIDRGLIASAILYLSSLRVTTKISWGNTSAKYSLRRKSADRRSTSKRWLIKRKNKHSPQRRSTQCCYPQIWSNNILCCTKPISLIFSTLIKSALHYLRYSLNYSWNILAQVATEMCFIYKFCPDVQPAAFLLSQHQQFTLLLLLLLHVRE